MALLRKLDFSDGPVNQLLFILRLDSLDPCVEEEMLFNSKVVPEHVELRADTNLKLNNLQLTPDAVAADPGVAVGRGVEASQLRYQSGLASAIRAEQTKQLTAADVERDVLIGDVGLAARSCWVHLADIFNDEGVRRVGVGVHGVDNLTLSLCVRVFVSEFVVIFDCEQVEIVVSENHPVQIRRDPLDQFFKQEEGVFGNSVLLRHHLVAVEGEQEVQDGVEVQSLERGVQVFGHLLRRDEALLESAAIS
mmetsp:Transcript_15183/g.23441  ORF Transcript_15183/g.23441 Transcript_15183/m.23441 type:complete len:250 (+) Transcript_15183:652-1401(+)